MFRNHELINEIEGLHRFARHLTRDPDEADDLLQATLTKALENKNKFISNSNLKGWCSKIMFNLFVSKYRRQRRYGSTIDPQPVIDSATEPGREFHYACCAELQQAWSKLDERLRGALDCYCFKDMRYQDIARELDLPIGTVRSRVYRARETLSKYVGTEIRN
ncbi:MAG: sigma-70 family RNA polymerase sigma factor [Gammaproteobacteria bacterium]